jgi:anion-transporting  ArsA/GET3 family ATPase
MNIDQEDLETFLIETELISQKVKALAENRITPEEIDRLELVRSEDRRRREEAKQRKEI